jgi:hypothetical protein
VLNHFRHYHIKILLGDFNAKLGEVIFKLKMGNEGLREGGVRVVNFTMSENLVVDGTMFSHRNIRKYTWTCPGGKIHSHIDHV